MINSFLSEIHQSLSVCGGMMARFCLVSFLVLSVLAVLSGEENTKAKLTDNSKVASSKTEGSSVRGVQAGNRKRKNKKVYKKSRKQFFIKRKEKKNGRRKNKQGKSKSNINTKRKNKAEKKSQKKNKKFARQSCSSNQVNLTCMANAMEGMMFEKNQITNYLKQAKRLNNHESISTNKVGKKDNFDPARKLLLWALGGNLSDPKCGPNTTAEKTA